MSEKSKKKDCKSYIRLTSIVQPRKTEKTIKRRIRRAKKEPLRRIVIKSPEKVRAGKVTSNNNIISHLGDSPAASKVDLESELKSQPDIMTNTLGQ